MVYKILTNKGATEDQFDPKLYSVMRVELGVGNNWNNLGRVHVQRARPSGQEHSYRQILLFISPPGCISDAMTAAIEREFSWVSVLQVSEPQMACEKFEWDVHLVIVDHSLLNAFQMHCDKLSETHPGAITAVMTTTRPDHMEQLNQIIEARAICGILPNNVNLDIWLSIIRIMLKGGEYFPHTLLQPRQLPEASDPSMPADRRPLDTGPREQRSRMMNELTARELEVLAMVAQGHQNKIIAFELGLSEHTVKIHLHNIIQKLGVHNRTEAASKYFDYNHNQKEAHDDEADREKGDGDGREHDRSGKRSPPPID